MTAQKLIQCFNKIKWLCYGVVKLTMTQPFCIKLCIVGGKVVCRAAYHLVAKENEKGTLFGDQELWVDKENWFVLKMILKSGDNEVDLEHKVVEFEKVFDEDTIMIEIPEGVEIQDMDEVNESTTVTIEEAAQHVGQPLLDFPEADTNPIATVDLS